MPLMPCGTCWPPNLEDLWITWPLYFHLSGLGDPTRRGTSRWQSSRGLRGTQAQGSRQGGDPSMSLWKKQISVILMFNIVWISFLLLYFFFFLHLGSSCPQGRAVGVDGTYPSCQAGWLWLLLEWNYSSWELSVKWRLMGAVFTQSRSSRPKLGRNFRTWCSKFEFLVFHTFFAPAPEMNECHISRRRSFPPPNRIL